MKFNSILITLFITGNVFASWDRLEKNFDLKTNNQRSNIINLVGEKLYFSALPLMKDYMSRNGSFNSQLDEALTEMIRVVGIKQFESLPYSYLDQSKAASVRYILAKKYMRDEKYNQASRELSAIKSVHYLYPFAKNMQGVIASISKDYAKAIVEFRECESSSKERLSSTKNENGLKLNRDYCILGVARSKFAAKEYNQTELLYLDIPKNSQVWPEILFEEAWNSYYKNDYNRTLGKLVTYKAPVLSHIFNPEVDVLTALTYLKLCLYNDAKEISNTFYDRYLEEARSLRLYLKKYNRNLSYYYDLVSRYESKGEAPTKLLKEMFKSVEKEQVYIDMKDQYQNILKEYELVKSKRNTTMKRRLLLNLQEAIRSQKQIFGGYIRSKLVSYYVQIYKGLEGMSYIKLEVLAQRKAKLYSFEKDTRTRGSIQYIKRNDKQYFWDFNGEFWADELGDYVFALRSEC